MKVESYDGPHEREILTAMLVHRGVLARVADKWKAPGLFASRYANVVGTWAVAYCLEHAEAPKRHVESLFAAWAQTARDDATVKLVETFLQSISDEHESAPEINEEYVVKLAENHFNKTALKKRNEIIEGHLEAGRLDEAEKAALDYCRVEMSASAGIDVLSDKEFVKRVMDRKDKNKLFEYPGDIGKFFDVPDCFGRDCLVSFLGVKGRGKSWWLIDAAWRAMEQRRKVALFQIGDMSAEQVGQRLLTRAAGRPLFAGTYDSPVSLKREGEGVKHQREKVTLTNDLSGRDVWCSLRETVKHKIKSADSYLKLSVHPARSLSVPGLTAVLRNWERQGFVPDVVVLDYADLLAPMDSKIDKRDQINESWLALRALSQTLHCLVITATQAKAAAYYIDLLTMDHFTDDRRKFDHMNSCIGINQTVDEKAADIQRLNFVTLREGAFDERRVVHCALCLPAANPCVRSLL